MFTKIRFVSLLVIFSLFISLSFSNSIFAQTTIWSETFPEGNNTRVDPDGSWSLDPSNDNNFSIRSNELRARGPMNGSWTSENIDISGFDHISLFIDVRAEGDMEDADYIRLEYNLDGNGWNTFDINGYIESNFGSETAIQNNLNGSSLELRIRMVNSANNEYYYVDNIVVAGNSYTTISYCASNGTMDYNDGISRVNFNTINNVTVKPEGYNDYTPISTDLDINSTYDLTVNINTDGNYTNYAFAWIDWNNDGDFNGAEEEYDLGFVTNNANGVTSNSPVSITVPSYAVVGTTRMRISTKYANYPTACEPDFDGEVEDYSIIINPSCSIATQSVTGGGSYCEGNTGIEVGLDGSEIGVDYQLYRNGAALVGSAISGNGNALSFGFQTGAGTYTVVGHNVSEDCYVSMNGSAQVVVKSVPSVPTVGTVTQPDCSSSSGSVVLNGLPSTGTWILTQNPGGTMYTGVGASTTITGLTENDYTFTVTHHASGTGLSAEYFNNMTLTGTPDLTQTDATVNFNWASAGPGSSIGVDNFSVRWSGKILPLYTENYTFTTNSDDGIRLWVNGVQVINNWTNHAATINTGTINLAAGVLYDIVLEFYENGGQAVAQLFWGSASQSTEIIPQSQLYPTGTETSDCPSPSTSNIVINAQPVGPSIDSESLSSATYCKNETANPLSVTASGDGLHYQWYSNASSSSSGGTTVGTDSQSYTPSTASEGTLYYYVVVSGDCSPDATSNFSGAVTVTPLPTVVANATSTEICAGESVTLSGSGATSYVWDNGVTDGVSFTPASTTTYTVNGTDANGCENTDQITITVNPLPTTPSATSNSPVCDGSAIQLNTPTVTGVTYNWSGPNGYTSTEQNPVLTADYYSNSGIYSVTITANGCTSEAGSTEVVIDPVSVGGWIEYVAPICEGTSATLTLRGNTGDVIRWERRLNSGTWENVAGTSTTLTNTPPSAGTWEYRAVVQSGSCETANSIPIAVTVNATPAITLGTNPEVCQNVTNAIITYSATGGSPDDWSLVFDASALSAGFYNQIGSLDPVPGAILVNVPYSVATGTYNAVLTVFTYSPSCTSIEYPVSITVTESTPPSLVIVGNNEVCAGTEVTFSATPTNGGASPIYQWKVNGINNGTNSNSFSYTPADGDVVTCDMTSSATCAGSGSSMSNEIIMIVNPLPDTGEIIPD
ncbi:PA14 domain-containing protein [Draconibacterium orientale]|uniref:PA14 domain-containing protein n=1 Tax=Draconibacterium orientale TaxID=1168034 RepID=UPI002ABDE788|nr:PA14 domain-containing protein [Draconibacterium orientale]